MDIDALERRLTQDISNAEVALRIATQLMKKVFKDMREIEKSHRKLRIVK